jgi:VWFA-related protein
MKKLLRILLFPLLLATPLLAEDVPGDGESSPDPQDFFSEIVDVTVVNVDVYVTDKKGNPITGLTQDDFEVLDGGKPVEITNFYAIENQRVVAQNGVEPLARPTVSMDPRLPPPLPENQQLHLVLYVDNVNIHPLNRQKVMTRVRSFLRRHVSSQDRMMVVSYDRSLNVRQPFTQDKEKVIAALLETDELSGHRTAYNAYRNEVLQTVFDADELFDVSGIVRKYAESIYHDIEQSQDALKRTVDSLAGLPGR